MPRRVNPFVLSSVYSQFLLHGDKQLPSLRLRQSGFHRVSHSTSRLPRVTLSTCLLTTTRESVSYLEHSQHGCSGVDVESRPSLEWAHLPSSRQPESQCRTLNVSLVTRHRGKLACARIGRRESVVKR
ncbi:uncharacterized protein LOC143152308 [Ptiloglossa arizonensis]|uniref:uncharacterized protein LOC143152308 n=1 Tax=Ptiloglossa arizonensis TaxID=3350558 RepID=UPI003FA0FA40